MDLSLIMRLHFFCSHFSLLSSLKTYSKEAVGCARSLSEFVDVEHILKSIHKVSNAEDFEHRKSNIIHTPIRSNTKDINNDIMKPRNQLKDEESHTGCSC